MKNARFRNWKQLAQALGLSLGVTAMAGCLEGSVADGLALTKDTGGPKVIYNVLEDDFPEIPMPNNQATRLDPTSMTGRRLNVSEIAPTEYEMRTRRKFNDLDGFGTYAPIFVSFDGLLDLEDVWQRHNLNNDFRDDAFFLLNVDESCDRFGEEVALDMGRGRFPVTLYNRANVTVDPESPHGFRRRQLDKFSRSGSDPHGMANNLLFEEHNEDFNGNGILDPGEDLDYDGQLDVANFIEPTTCDGVALYGSDGNVNPDYDQEAYDMCVADNLMTWYERESNTLIMRPIWPLEQRCTYAVVLTDRLRDESGASVVSPFKAINHRDQTNDLKPMLELLPRYGLSLENVSFAWTFTTGSMTHAMESLRAGLHGVGAFSQLKNEFPVSSFRVWTEEELNGASVPETGGTPAVVQGGCAGAALAKYWNVEGEWEANLCAIEADMASIGAVFGGSFKAPDLLVDDDGIATELYPSTDDESWRVDLKKGEATYGETDVTYWCALPIEKTDACSPGNPEGMPFCKPYPTILYGHGYGGSRAEVAVGHMGRTTAMGYAMCATDAYGHGLNVFADENTLEGALFASKLERELDKLGIPEMRRIMVQGRDRDLNNDTVPDSGADMWTSDVFHTRDMVRQSVLETVQMVRILRNMDGTQQDSTGKLLGDVDGDGIVDIGGAKNTVGMWGISLGGILSGVAAGAEPTLNAVSPNAGGGGLVDIAVRSSQQGVPQAVVLPMLGPFVVGCLPTDGHERPITEGEAIGCFSNDLVEPGTLELAFIVTNNAREKTRFFASVEGVSPGDVLEIRNLNNGEVDRIPVNAWGNVRVSVPSDALRAIERRSILGMTDRSSRAKVIDSDTAKTLGHQLVLTVTSGQTGETISRVDAFQEEVEFQGTIYPEGTTLVAIQEGLGLKRNTPKLRRFFGFAQSALGPADPAVWSARVTMEPGDYSYDPNWTPGMTHVLQMPTAGDKQVPVNTGIAMGRISGLFGSWMRSPETVGPEHGWREIFVPNPTYGQPTDELLIDRYVVEGDPRFARFPENPVHHTVIYDIDNISDGLATFSCGDSDWSAKIGENGCPDDLKGQEILFPVPHPELPETPLRVSVQREDGSYDAFGYQCFDRLDSTASTTLSHSEPSIRIPSW